MMRYFYDKKAKIERRQDVKLNGSINTTYVSIYDSVPCAFWATNKTNYQESTTGRESDTRTYTANFPGEFIDVLAGDKLTLTEKSGKVVGEYIVLDVIEYPDLRGKIDNIALTIKIRYG